MNNNKKEVKKLYWKHAFFPLYMWPYTCYALTCIWNILCTISTTHIRALCLVVCVECAMCDENVLFAFFPFEKWHGNETLFMALFSSASDSFSLSLFTSLPTSSFYSTDDTYTEVHSTICAFHLNRKFHSNCLVSYLVNSIIIFVFLACNEIIPNTMWQKSYRTILRVLFIELIEYSA